VKLRLKSGPVNYLDQGKGPAVLLIHAFPLNHTMWEPQLPVLSTRFRVIAPDIRGFGESQPASAWTMDDMADDLNELLVRLDGRLHRFAVLVQVSTARPQARPREYSRSRRQ
jgi:pimeloyl-ACP methyl ester carboxylesterase